MNDVATQDPGAKLPVDMEAFKTGLTNAKSQLSSAAGPGKPFLKLAKAAGWMYGAEDIEVEEGSRWAFNPLSLLHGWVCWKDTDKHGGKAEKLGEVMVPVTQPNPAKPPPHELGNWNQQFQIDLKCVTGEDKGVEVTYNGTSYGLMKAMNEYVGELLERVSAGDDAIVGVTTLESTHYKHEKYGRVYNPVFSFDEWITMDGVAAVPAVSTTPAAAGDDKTAAAEPAGEPAAAAPAEAAAEPAPAAEAAPAEGSQRRRRRRG